MALAEKKRKGVAKDWNYEQNTNADSGPSVYGSVG
jgi:hypothetical protein